MVKAAILGIGTVGGGTAEVLAKNRELIARRAGQEIELKYILCRSPRPGHPLESLIVHDIEPIASDPEVGVVAECMGGLSPAFEYVSRCLGGGEERGDLEQGARGGAGAGADGAGKEDGRELHVRGQRGRRDTHPAPDKPVPGRERDKRGLRHTERHDELHPDGDDPARQELRAGPARGAGEGLRGGGPHRGRGGHRRRAQDMHPRGPLLRQERAALGHHDGGHHAHHAGGHRLREDARATR